MSRYEFLEETSSRFAMKRNEVEEFLLHQRKKIVEKEKNKAIRQLQSLQKEKRCRGQRKQQQSSNKNAQWIPKSSTCIPELKEEAKFTAIKSCLIKNRGESKKCQYASSWERAVPWRRPSFCKETMNLSITPVFSKTNNKRLTHCNSLANISTTSNNWKTWQRKLSTPESKNEILKIQKYFESNKKLDSEVNEVDISLIPALQNNEKEISVVKEKDNCLSSSLPPDKGLLCQKCPKVPSLTRQLSATEATPLKLLSAQNNTTSEKQTPMQEAMYSKGNFPCLNFTALAFQENKLHVPRYLNDSETNSKRLFLSTIIPSASGALSSQLLFRSPETKLSQFQGETSKTTKERYLTIKDQPSIKVEKELETDVRQVRECSVDLTLSDTEKMIATQAMLRKLEIERASTNARKLAQKRFGDLKDTKRPKIGISFGATPIKSPERFREADKKEHSSNTMKSYLKEKQMEIALEALSKDLENCCYLRHENLDS